MNYSRTSSEALTITGSHFETIERFVIKIESTSTRYIRLRIPITREFTRHDKTSDLQLHISRKLVEITNDLLPNYK